MIRDTLERIKNSGQRRWLHRKYNSYIQNMAVEVNQHANFLSPESPVIFMNASTRLRGMSLNSAFSLLSSWSLELSGIPVAHFACEAGMSRCVLGTNRINPEVRPPCKECIAQSRVNYASNNVQWFQFDIDHALEWDIQPLGLAELLSFEYQGFPLGRLVLPSLRWILRRHHLEDDESTRYLYREYLLSAWNVFQQFAHFLDKIKPRAVVVFNGMFYPEAAVRWIANQNGIRVISHEVGLRPFTGFFTDGEATAYPIHIPPDFTLIPEQNERLDGYLQQRFEGNFSMAGIRFWSQMEGISPDFLKIANNFRQIVSIFTNVIFDTSQDHANVVFPDMFDWLDKILVIMRTHPETYFVIRAHPDESRPGKESRESVADWIEKNRVKELPNVMFVDAREPFSSYELILKSKFVMVYNSTIGLEASILGAPVLCGGKARFTQLPTVFFPASIEGYSRQADLFLKATDIKVPPEYKENARRFLYYQLFRSSLPFDQYLREDKLWPGYVAFKQFKWQDLLPGNSPTMQTIVNGILNNQPFLLSEESR
jgi:hypothetical protein